MEGAPQGLFFEGNVEWGRMRCLSMLFLTGPPAAEAATSLKLPINIFQFQSRYNVVSCLNFICNIYFTGKARESAELTG